MQLLYIFSYRTYDYVLAGTSDRKGVVSVKGIIWASSIEKYGEHKYETRLRSKETEEEKYEKRRVAIESSIQEALKAAFSLLETAMADEQWGQISKNLNLTDCEFSKPGEVWVFSTNEQRTKTPTTMI